MLLHGQVRLAGERGFLFTTLEKIMYPLQILTMAKHSKLRYNQIWLHTLHMIVYDRK